MKIKLKKGLTLKIAGGLPENSVPKAVQADSVAIIPDDFTGFVPKVDVKDGDKVAVGTPILHDKQHNDVKLVSPVAGTVKSVVRGDRRKILRVEIEIGKNEVVSPTFTKPTDETSAKLFLAESGMLALMRQRPYDIVPNPSDTVRDVYVTAFDLAPLAISYNVFNASFTQEDYEAGVQVLSKTTKGKIYVSKNSGSQLKEIKGTETIEIEGQYPASNVGVQIANTHPINKGETVWTLDLATLGRIGKLARTGNADFTAYVAVEGPEVKVPYIAKTVCGAAVEPIVKGALDTDKAHKRIISGNVFTGTAVDKEGYLHFPYRQITVIAEGDDVDEFMGWASFSPSKMSESRSFPGHFLGKLFRPDARLNGGRRAMIMSGEYDKTFPMDILPEYLLKAVISHNIEDMEKLGIYEVAPEDFAAAEYSDTSKMPLQQIVRDGLDYLRKELE